MRRNIEILRWIWRGKSARRGMLNVEVQNAVSLQGLVLDIGGKDRPSYREVILQSLGSICLVMDISPGEQVSILGDIISTPFRNSVFDSVMCFNVLEHVYNYRAALSEIRRILKPDGLLYGYVPFICNVHSDPCDYWRFTQGSIEKIMEESGFLINHIRPHIGVFCSCFDLSSFLVKKIPAARTILAGWCLLADSLLIRFRPDIQERFPLGYFFIGQKLQEN